jgi:hypothetical protein
MCVLVPRFVPMFMPGFVAMLVVVVTVVLVRMLRLCCFVGGGIFEGISRTQLVCLPGAACAKETAWAARVK